MDDFETLSFSPAETAKHIDAWQALNARALSPNPFFGPDFLLPYLANMEKRKARICAVRRRADGAFAALAPFVRRRPGLIFPAAVALANDYGPLGTPLLAPDAPAQALVMLFELAGQGSQTGVIAFPYMQTDGAAAAKFSEAASMGGWHLTMDNPQMRAGHSGGEEGEAQFSSVAKGRLKELNRQFRRLSELGETRFDSVSEPAQVIEAFQHFLTLEAKGWKGRKGSALHSAPERQRFTQAFIEAAAARGTLRIDSLVHAGEPIAMLVLLRALSLQVESPEGQEIAPGSICRSIFSSPKQTRFDGICSKENSRLFAWKIAFDEDFHRYSPGSQLTREAMRRNLADLESAGADSLAVPGHPMITPLWRGKIPYATALLAKGPLAASRIAALQSDMAAERWLRRVAKGVVGRVRG